MKGRLLLRPREWFVGELFGVVERIWADACGERSAFSWQELATGSQECILSLRAAQAALRGTG